MSARLNAQWHFGDRVLGELISLAWSPMLFCCFLRIDTTPHPSGAPPAQVRAGGGSALWVAEPQDMAAGPLPCIFCPSVPGLPRTLEVFVWSLCGKRGFFEP